MMEWINIKNSLPDPYKPVLLFCKSKNNKFYCIIEGYFCQSIHKKVYGDSPWAIKIFGEDNLFLCMEKNRIYDPGRQNAFIHGKVTHWANLSLPEGE